MLKIQDMELYYQKERDKDFFEVCEAIRKESYPEYISVDNIALLAIKKKAKSFYLSTKVCSNIINKVRFGCFDKIKNNIKKELYLELWLRYIQIKRQNPEFNSMDCARIIAEQEAPRFYIAEHHATNLYYKLLKSNQT